MCGLVKRFQLVIENTDKDYTLTYSLVDSIRSLNLVLIHLGFLLQEGQSAKILGARSTRNTANIFIGHKREVCACSAGRSPPKSI